MSNSESNVRLIIRLMGLKYLWVESILAVKMKRAPDGGCEYSLIFDFFLNRWCSLVPIIVCRYPSYRPFHYFWYWLLENWILYVFDETLDGRRTARLFIITPQNRFLGRSITIWQGSLGCSFVVSFGFCSFHSGNYNTPNPFRSGESPPIGIVFASDSLIVSGPHRPSIFPIFSKSMTFYRIQHF